MRPAGSSACRPRVLWSGSRPRPDERELWCIRAGALAPQIPRGAHCVTGPAGALGVRACRTDRKLILLPANSCSISRQANDICQMSVPALNITAQPNLRRPFGTGFRTCEIPLATCPQENPMTLPAYTGTLTPAHCQVIAGIRDQWAATVLSTAPVDRAATVEAVHRLYDAHKLPQPSLTIWMDSPLGCIYAAAVIGQLREQLRERFLNQLRHRQLQDQMGRPALGQARAPDPGPVPGPTRRSAEGPAQGPARGPAQRPGSGPAQQPALEPAAGADQGQAPWPALGSAQGPALGRVLGPVRGPAQDPVEGPVQRAG